jgi:thiamine pyrophosphokinase
MRYYREMGVEGTMFTDYVFFTPACGKCTFPSYPGQQVSIFNFGSTCISSEGLRWNSYAYDQWWQGTLNEALADTFTLSADSYYMVYQTY